MDIAQDAALAIRTPPGQVECGVSREKPNRLKIEVIVKPPRQIPPVPAIPILRSEPGDTNRNTGSRATPGVTSVPNVIRVARLVPCAFLGLHMCRSEPVHLRTAITGTDVNRPECLDQWLKQPTGELPAYLEREPGPVGKIPDTVKVRYLTCHKVTHLEVAGQALPSKLLECHVASRTSHATPFH